MTAQIYLKRILISLSRLLVIIKKIAIMKICDKNDTIIEDGFITLDSATESYQRIEKILY